MICNNCNSQLPEGSTFCNYCGATFHNSSLQPQNFGYNQQPSGYGYNQQPQDYGYNQQPQGFGYIQQNQPTYYNQQAPVAKKNKNGIIMGVIIAILYVVLIALIVFMLYRNNYEDDHEDFFPEIDALAVECTSLVSSHNGTYVLDHCEMFGLSYTIDELEAMSGESFDMSLIIHGDTCTLDAEAMGYFQKSCKIEFDGDDVTLIDGGEELYGTYDEDEESITFNSSGVDMVFVKE